MDDNKIPVTIYITPEYYFDKGHFWSRLNLVKRFHGVHNDKIMLLISYKYFKPNITEKQVEHFNETKRHFPNMAVIHAANVNWNGHDSELIGMDIPIYQCEYMGQL